MVMERAASVTRVWTLMTPALEMAVAAAMLRMRPGRLPAPFPLLCAALPTARLPYPLPPSSAKAGLARTVMSRLPPHNRTATVALPASTAAAAVAAGTAAL